MYVGVTSVHAEESPHDPFQGVVLPNRCAFHHKNSTICCMSSRCQRSRRGTQDAHQVEEDVPRKPVADDIPRGCADIGILAKAQSMVSRISGASRHTMSGHGNRRSQISVDEAVHVRDFGMEKEKEDEDEITVISYVPEKRG